jgi:hypothetical protein
VKVADPLGLVVRPGEPASSGRHDVPVRDLDQDLVAMDVEPVRASDAVGQAFEHVAPVRTGRRGDGIPVRVKDRAVPRREGERDPRQGRLVGVPDAITVQIHPQHPAVGEGGEEACVDRPVDEERVHRRVRVGLHGTRLLRGQRERRGEPGGLVGVRVDVAREVAGAHDEAVPVRQMELRTVRPRRQPVDDVPPVLVRDGGRRFS